MKDTLKKTLTKIYDRLESHAMNQVLLIENAVTFEAKVLHETKFRELKEMQAEIKQVQENL